MEYNDRNGELILFEDLESPPAWWGLNGLALFPGNSLIWILNISLCVTLVWSVSF